MNFSDWVPHVAGAAVGGLAAWVAIKSDIAAMKATIEILVKSIDRAHVRIDELRK